MPRVLGLDYGEKRLGFALSDETEMLATPLCVITCRDTEEALRAVQRMCEENKVSKLVVGLPVNMNGSRGPAVDKVLDFIKQLQARMSVPVETWDERLSTRQAESVLIDAGTSRRRRKEVIDKLAAQLMLQNCLDAKNLRHGPG